MTGKNEQQNSSENNNIPTTALTSSRSGRTVNNEIPPLPPPGGDEGGDASPFVQTGIARKNLQAASVTYLDGGAHAFYVHKNSTAEVLFEMVCAHLGLNEKDYFGLFFYDEQATRHTLYKDKVITKQLKALPWRFFFEVKFYPSQPTQLAEDLTRYLLRLQLRQDVFEERLPTSFAMQAKLGALSAQAQFGDYQPTDTYAQFLRGAEFAQVVTEQLLEKIVDLHKQYRGLTPSEAELAYLNECKDLAMYGVILHPAKDSKSKPTQIGVSAHGISVYNDQMRVHRFAWPNIIKFSYRRNVFSVKLKPGELEKKDTTATYKLADYPSAKRLWKCAVEHHTFFRLIQTESKPKSSLLRFGSSRFRYYGRTNFQTQMASQLFDGTQSARVTSKSFDNIATREHEIQPTATLDSTSRDKKSKNVGEGSIKKKEAKSKVEKAARKESGVDISSPSSTSSSSSSSSSDAEEVVEQPPQRNDIAEETERTGESPPYKLTSSVSAGPYALAPVDGRIIREETIEQVYRIVGGAGERIPHVDPANASLLGIVSKCVAETTSAPKVTYVEERSVVRDHGAIPDLIIKEASLPHSTVHTWHETSAGPETVTTEVDEHGNVVKRTVVKSEQVKHTVRTQSYQTFVVDENTAPNESSVTEKTPHSSPSKRSGISENTSSPPTTTTVAHTIAYENGAPADVTNTHQWTNGGAVRSTTSEFTEDDLVSTKAVTTGNRTVETLTYKKKKDGVMETHVEHRITIHGGDDIDHDAELSRAILEATNMNPEMTVEKVEVRQKKSIS